MSNLSLNIALSGMRTAQTALETLGNNLSNANTPGYSRQRPDIQQTRPMLLRGLNIGLGADVNGLSRVHDEVLSRRIVQQVGVAARFTASLQAMSGVQAVMQEPGGNGVGALMDGFFESVAELSTGAEDLVRRAGVSQASQELAAQFHQIADDTDQMRSELVGRVEALTREVNSTARQIRDLNVEIGKAESSGSSANNLRDRRDTALESLGALIDIKYWEGENGAVTVSVGGQLLSGTSLAHEMRVEINGDDQMMLTMTGASKPLNVSGGQIGGLMQIREEFLPSVMNDINALAYNFTREVNRIHSTGSIPGGFTQLSGSVSLADADGDGSVLDESLLYADLPFAIQAGELNVNVVDDATGELLTRSIAIDPGRMSVADLLNELSAIDGMNATVDSLGRVQVFSDSGSHFDFSTRLNARPDPRGTFGGAHASVTTSQGEPFLLADGMTLDIGGPISSYSVTLNAADFENISAASADELAAALNANAAVSANGMRAVTMGDFVALQTAGTGTSESFDIVGGTALGALGLAPTTVTGHETGVEVTVKGPYTGDVNRDLVFRPLSDGKIGTTPGLQIEVRDGNGTFVTTLSVGAEYVPGNDIVLPDGMAIKFSVGEVSATHNDVLVQRTLADGDTSDILVGLGINALFTGTDARSFNLEQRLIDEPGLIATSTTGESGDNGVLLRLQALQSSVAEGLGMSFGEFYGVTVSEIGFRVATTETAAETEAVLVDSLRARKQEISGVNVDEELVDMIRFEQQFGAVAQFIQVVNQLSDTVLNLI